MTIDVIILSNAKTEKLKQLTQQAIDSCRDSDINSWFNIIVIEQAKHTYANCFTMFYNAPFNYNGFMNYGISITKNEYIALCNNDLIFEKDWAKNIIEAMKAHDLLSASPRCPVLPNQKKFAKPGVYEGYNNAQHLSGWCIVINRKLFDIIGKLDDEFPFWFADNVYGEQLKKHGVKHALVSNSIVTHLQSQTLNTMPPDLHKQLTSEQISRFLEKYPDNESARYFKSH